MTNETIQTIGFYRYWDVVDYIPEGYKIDKNLGSPKFKDLFIRNGSPLKGGKTLLYKLPDSVVEATQKAFTRMNKTFD